MRFAYADPPYPGKARKYYSADPRCAEVDHVELIGQLCREYPDGWALSSSSPSLKMLLALCPDDVRVMAWIRRRPGPMPGVRLTYAWEPVLLRGGRATPDVPHMYDWHSSEPQRGLGLVGAKPPEFCEWVLRALGYEDGDTLDDLYPGTGSMGVAVSQLRVPA